MAGGSKLQFHFINGKDIDANARKEIRSSVMLGRNTKKRRIYIRPKPRELLPETAARNDTPIARDAAVDVDAAGTAGDRRSPEKPGRRPREEQQSARAIQLYPRVGDELSSLAYAQPLDLTTRMRILQFIHMSYNLIYPRELCFQVDECHRVWLDYLQSNEAFVHSFLAMVDTYVSSQVGTPGHKSIILQHLSNTYKSINRRLQQESAPSDATIASVMSIAMYNNIILAPSAVKLHLHALKKMVTPRMSDRSSPLPQILLHKIYRTDIEHSLQTGCVPQFYSDSFPYEAVRMMPDWHASTYEAMVTTTAAGIYDINLQLLFRDLLCASRYLNAEAQTLPKMSPFDFQGIIVAVCYRVLHVYPLETGLSPTCTMSRVEEACYLALLALMTTMLMRAGHAKVSYSLIARRFRDSVLAVAGLGTGADSQFLLWSLFVGGISVWDVDGEDGAWVFQEMRRCVMVLGVGSWQEVWDTCLFGFPWIRHFHDKAGLELWDAYTKAELGQIDQEPQVL
ncbi:hypothetical protein DRE_01543 [Drechslerella stenobrocha 248]|uniref:Transcription factor domain-containing protein n=1 Tax=Drechslerella stenobrocha 248 TaxID=1043628 RepID=W7HIF3_9PEZI|nr:hypothetical protein DRE_01543 [Drechslerella stenobrocha 248]